MLAMTKSLIFSRFNQDQKWCREVSVSDAPPIPFGVSSQYVVRCLIARCFSMKQDSNIIIPSILADKSLSNFFRGWHWPKSHGRKVTLNLKNTNFLAPWALTLLGAYAAWLKHKRKDVRVELNSQSYSGAFAIQAGL